MDDSVAQLHLEHRLVRRLLARFLSHGFPPAELSGVCVAPTHESHPSVLLLARVSLFGPSAARLHDELIVVGATIGPAPLEARPESDAPLVWGHLDAALHGDGSTVPDGAQRRLRERANQDVASLRPELERRVKAAAADATRKLNLRGQTEAAQLRAIIQGQLQHCRDRLKELKGPAQLLTFGRDDLVALNFDSDREGLEARLATLREELSGVPSRVELDYRVEVTRVLLVGLVYLWPVTG